MRPSDSPSAVPRQSSMWMATGLATIACWLVLVLLYHDTFRSVVGVWLHSKTFEHGLFVFPICGYLIWEKRAALARVSPRPSLLLAGIPFLLALLWLVGWAAEAQALKHAAVVLLVPALAAAIAGREAARVLAFPILFSVFAVPVGEAFVPVLQDFTAAFSASALRHSGVPVVIEGRLIQVPGGSWEVAEACGGLRYLIASLMLASLFAHWTCRSASRSLLFIALSAVVAILANGVRAYGIILLGYVSGMKLATGVDHVIYGWVFFVMVMILFWILVRRWFREQATPAAASVRQGDAPSFASLPPSAPRRIWISVASIVVFVALAPLFAAWADARLAPTAAIPVEPAPRLGAPWVGPLEDDDPQGPRFAGAQLTIRKVYVCGGSFLHFFAAYYGAERQGGELINSENSVYDRERWIRLSDTQRQVSLGSERIPVRETRLGRGQAQSRVWYWYRVGGASTADPYVAKMLEVWSRFRPARVPSAVFVLAVEESQMSGDAENVLLLFLRGAAKDLGLPTSSSRSTAPGG